MAVNYIKTLTLEIDTANVECQLTTAQITSDSSEGAETLTTFCGSEDVPGIGKWTLHIAGFQDWGQAEAVTELLHTAYLAGQDGGDDSVAFVLEAGGSTRTGNCRPTEDVPFGGDAGAAFTFEGDLAVIGRPTDGTTP